MADSAVMRFLQPRTWTEAVRLKAEHPGAVPIAGGTDVMVGLNFGAPPPPALLDLTRIGEIAGWDSGGDVIRLGAAVTYRRIIAELGGRLPALAAASRTVGSPQIRNRATVAGNLGTASPAGDAHPPLLATRARVEVESVRGSRLIDIDDFFRGPKRHALAPDELIRAVWVPAATGPQQFAKVGARNAMVIGLCSVAVVLDPVRRRVGVAIGSAAPTPRRAVAAEEFAAGAVPWAGDRADGVNTEPARRFGELVAAAAEPIDDVRATAAYRRRSLAVLGRRAYAWAVAELTGQPSG